MHPRSFLNSSNGSPGCPSARPAVAPYQIIELCDLCSKSRCAESEEQGRHHNENGKLRPVFEEICSAQNDRAHECDKIGRGKQRAERIKNPRHGFAWKNESGKENARQ